MLKMSSEPSARTHSDLGVECGEPLLQLRHDAQGGGLLPLRRQLGAQRRVPLRQRRDAGQRRRLCAG